ASRLPDRQRHRPALHDQRLPPAACRGALPARVLRRLAHVGAAGAPPRVADGGDRALHRRRRARRLAGPGGVGHHLVSWCGLVVLVAQASRAGAVMEAALQETLGEDYRADMAPELCDDDDPVLRWQRLVLPIRTRDR